MARAASGLTDPRAVIATLAERLGDRDAEIRLAALRGLVAIGPTAGVAAPNELGAALKDESADQRAMAVTALAGFPRGLDPWLPTVFRMMEHDDEPRARAIGRSDGTCSAAGCLRVGRAGHGRGPGASRS